jgi:hypothetical protein
MDDAARRVKPRNLRMAVRLREQRERRALMDLKSALANRDAAQQAHTHSRQELMARQALRHAAETQAYRALAEAGPLSPAALTGHLAGIESLTESVQSASLRAEEARLHAARAEQAASHARSAYATLAHRARKWARMAAMVATSHRVRVEHLSEIEADEEGSLRARHPRGMQSAVR